MSADNGVYILKTRAGEHSSTRLTPEAALQQLRDGVRNLLNMPVSSLVDEITKLAEEGACEGFEYRVRELMCVDNFSWDNKRGRYTDDADVQIVNARGMWSGCEVITSQREALVEAGDILDSLVRNEIPCEYGISFIEIDREF